MAKILESSVIFLITVLIKCLVSNADPCFNQFDSNHWINISKVTKPDTNKGQEAKSWYYDTRDNFTFYFHGCNDTDFDPVEFGITGKKVKASLVVVNNADKDHNGSVSFALTSNITTYGHDNEGGYYLAYNDSNPGRAILKIYLICSTLNTTFSITEPNNNETALISPLACLISNEHHHGLSGGSIFLIILLVALAIYLIGGCLIMHFLRGARGLEVIPNIDFWRELPGLVKDGLIFLLNGCSTSFISTAETYDRI